MKDADAVLEELEELVEELEAGGRNGAIVVEGRRDEAALRALGIDGDVRPINRGVALLRFCEELAAERRHAVVLVDWDEKGDELADKLRLTLTRLGVAVDIETRRALRRLTRGSVYTVEELPSFHRRIKAAAVAKGPERSHAWTWRERKAEVLRLKALRRQRGGPPGRRP